MACWLPAWAEQDGRRPGHTGAAHMLSGEGCADGLPSGDMHGSSRRAFGDGFQAGGTGCTRRVRRVRRRLRGLGCGPAPGLLEKLRGALKIWGAEMGARRPKAGV